MRKITIIALLGIVIGVLIGIYVFKMNNLNKSLEEKGKFAVVEDECTKTAELSENEDSKTKLTGSTEIKISPNTKMTMKIYYNRCKHLISQTEKNSENLINKTEDEIREKYKDWEVKKFSSEEIVLYKEVADFCNEHYMLKDENGYIVIYQLDEDDNELKIYKSTEIETKYLSEEDIIKLKEGIKVYTNTELNKKIEDFE